MFFDFYQLKEQPFGVTPDPRYLYLSQSHREALASLFYGVRTGRGLMALIAPPGMGKTTLLFHFLEHLQRSARTAYLFQTQCDSSGLLRYLLADLHVDARGQDFVAMHEKLNELLLQEAHVGRRFVLVIDESQNLDDSVLETARLLSDFETPREKLLQIVFAGQPQLADKLSRPELAQLRQRIAVLSRIEPLCASDVKGYIEHRLHVAGYRGPGLFTSAALESIAACTQGIPRNINNVCFGALSIGCALRVKPVDADLIAEAAADLDMDAAFQKRGGELLPVVMPVSLGHSYLRQRPYAVHSGEDEVDGSLQIHLVGLNCCEDSGGILEALRAVAQPLSAQSESAPIRCAQTDPPPHVAEDSQGLDCAAGLRQRGEARSDNEDGEHTELPRGVDASADSFVREKTFLIPSSVLSAQIEPRRILSKRQKAMRLLLSAALVFTVVLGFSFTKAIRDATATFVSYSSNFKDKPYEAYPTSGQPLPVSTTATPKGSVASPGAESAATAQEISARASRLAFSDRGRQTRAARIKFGMKPLKSSDRKSLQGSTVIIVQPNDDLRQICLRHFNSFNGQLLNRLFDLNAELTDPDRIYIGERIVLPKIEERALNVTASLVSKP